MKTSTRALPLVQTAWNSKTCPGTTLFSFLHFFPSKSVYTAAIHCIAQSVEKTCRKLNITVFPLKLSIDIGGSEKASLPTEETSTAPMLHDSVGSTDGVRLADGRIDVVIDGEALGVLMGPELEAKVGAADGLDTGVLLEPKLGAADGLLDGLSLGYVVGTADGPSMGAVLGNALGRVVGLLDDHTDGEAFGLVLGLEDGALERDAAGKMLGAALGLLLEHSSR
jgi:hypothetical protein